MASDDDDQRVALADLHLFHRNPRKGNVDKIVSSLVTHGQFKPLVVNRGTQTGRPNEILAGNHTYRAIQQLGGLNPFDAQWQTAKVHFVDVSDDRANHIVLADNQTFELGEGTDPEIVLELLHQAGGEGTGYELGEIEALEAKFAQNGPIEPESGEKDPPEEPAKPSLPQRDAIISFTIIFDNEEQQKDWFAFVEWLADKYPDPDLTLADRLVEHIAVGV